MTKEQIAESLFEEACKAQWRREHPKELPENADPRKVACVFEKLHPCSKDNYLAMAEWVLNNKERL